MSSHRFALLDLDDLVTDEDQAMRASVRAVLERDVRPHLAQWYDEGSLPARDLAWLPGRPSRRADMALELDKAMRGAPARRRFR